MPDADTPPDSSPIGGIINKKSDNHIRISSINPNGLRFSTLPTAIQFSLDLDTDIQCFSEINLDTQQRAVRRQLLHRVRTADPKAKSTWSSSQVPAVNTFKPGGTGMITYSRLASKVRQMGSDPMGRWTYRILNGKSDIELLVISIYQSCTHQGTDDGMTFHTQQKILLAQMDRPSLDPRPNFLSDLKSFLHKHINTPHTPIAFQ